MEALDHGSDHGIRGRIRRCGTHPREQTANRDGIALCRRVEVVMHPVAGKPFMHSGAQA